MSFKKKWSPKDHKLANRLLCGHLHTSCIHVAKNKEIVLRTRVLGSCDFTLVLSFELWTNLQMVGIKTGCTHEFPGTILIIWCHINSSVYEKVGKVVYIIQLQHSIHLIMCLIHFSIADTQMVTH